jgi:hypothetical protein
VITRDEWNHEKWKEAAKVRGRRRASWYGFLMDAPVYLTLAAVGGLGWGAWWVWHQLMAHLHSAGTDTLPGTIAHSGVPAWVPVAGLLLIAVTVWLFHPGRIDGLGVLVAKWTLVPVAWLFLLGFTISSALG